ncbi:tail fiber domain-containing protein [Foetidibacter luteolus]|uniref:tail fiber domain-containing protein n=1 Tax=Foetidibacter luteolus TaxID=2608880 RepID=UPI00129BEF16|nr:tail fiber domain-containing protein [Foetidibacter luteolus]
MKAKFYPAMIIALLIIAKDVNAQANQNLSNLVSPVAVNKNLSPFVNNGINLGTPDKAWKDIYLGSALYLKQKLVLHQVGTTNFFVGPLAGKPSLTGSYNTGAGFSALSSLTGGLGNTAYGNEALFSNTEGLYNSAVGYRALYANTYGGENTAMGVNALKNNVGGMSNSAFGASTLSSNTDGEFNTAVGYYSLFDNIGSNNTAVGTWSLVSNTEGQGNTAVGSSALYQNGHGNDNTGIGTGALVFSAQGSANTAVGAQALAFNPGGSYNTAVGCNAIGENALDYDDAQQYNTALGYNAGGSTGNRSFNTFIGAQSSANIGGLQNVTAIGYNSRVTANDQVRIGNDNVTSIGGFVNWSTISDGRYKKNVKSNVVGLAFINKLNPVTYSLDMNGLDDKMTVKQHRINLKIKNYTFRQAEIAAEDQRAMAEKGKIVYSGFVAQDVEKAAKETGYEFSGVDAPKNDNDLYGLRYAEFVVPLVKAVQELSKQNDKLSEQVDKLLQQNEAMQQEITALKGKALPVVFSGASLEQNTPNPFSGSTVINYSLPEKFNKAQLVIYDAAGKAIRQINLASQQGKGRVTLNAANLAAGAYSCSLLIDGNVAATKQMVMAK